MATILLVDDNPEILRIVVPTAASFILLELIKQDIGLHPICHFTRLMSELLLSIPFGGAIGAVIVRELGNSR